MSKQLLLALGLFLVLSTSCVKDVFLDPFQFPEVLNAEVFRVDALNDSVFFAATATGLFYQYGDKEWFMANVEDLEMYWDRGTWDQAEIAFGDDYVLCAFENQYQRISAQGIIIGEFQSMIRPSLIVTPGNEVIRIGLTGGDFIPGVPFEEYFVSIERFISTDSTDLFVSEMVVTSENWGSVQATFDDSEAMYITTNPIYRLTNWDVDEPTFEAIEPVSGVTNYTNLAFPVYSNGVIYGYDRKPEPNVPVTRIFSFDLANGEVLSSDISNGCTYSENSLGPIKHLASTGSSSVLFHRTISTQASGSSGNLGFLQFYDFQESACDLTAIPTASDLRFSASINDVGYSANGDQVLLGSKTKLYSYSLENDSIQPYLQSLLDL